MPFRASVYIGTSLDGFIAREDGGLDWLTGDPVPGEDFGYAEFVAGIDTLVVGRGTFEKVLTFGEWPYAGKRVVVLSSSLTPEAVPAEVRAEVEIHPGPVQALVAHLERTGARHVYVDGGKAIQSFLRAGTLDEITVTRLPVLIGRGIPLFGALDRDVRLRHLRTRAFDNGFVQSTYSVVAEAQAWVAE